MKIPEFEMAFSKAREVNELLTKTYSIGDDTFVPLDAVLESVKELTDYSDVKILRSSFSQILKDDKKARRYGAMLSTEVHQEQGMPEIKSAKLLINTDCSAEMQRFSVAHELGHLITSTPNYSYGKAQDGRFTLSTHVNPDITFIDEKECCNSPYLIAEQVANIFALLVLIRRDIRIRDLVENGAKNLAQRYGVTEDALYSRMLLSTIKNREKEDLVNESST